VFFFQAEDGIRDFHVTGVQTCALPISGATPITADVFELVNNPEIDIVIELIGGYTIAKELVLKAIDNGKHVVTANKALIAVHGKIGRASCRERVEIAVGAGRGKRDRAR